MNNLSKDAQNKEKKSKKRRSEEEKLGRRKWIIKTLKDLKKGQRIIDRRTRMLAAGLRELFILGEDYVSMVTCKDEVDKAILYALFLAEFIG